MKREVTNQEKILWRRRREEVTNQLHNDYVNIINIRYYVNDNLIINIRLMINLSKGLLQI